MACSAPSAGTTGHWIGDLRRAPAAERMEVIIDSSNRSARVTLAGWQLNEAVASSVPAGEDSVAFIVVADGDTVAMRGVMGEDTWTGEARRGSERAGFVLQRLQPLAESEWKEMVGTYRAPDGHLVGIAPFSEFGSQPLLVDYSSGRIGPLYPIAPGRLMVGHALISPVHPADTLELDFGPGQKIQGLRFVERGQQAVLAQREATRDLEVEFTNGPIVLRGTLTLPAGSGPSPAMVLVHGSNALTREVFGPWSRFFAGQGFAVLAYDKRGTGGSAGDWKTADFSVLADDVLAGVRFLATRSDIRPDRIGLWGASQAGWIMPLAAMRAPREIAFLVVHAGSGTTVRQQGILYIESELRMSGLPESAVAIGVRYQQFDDSVTSSGRGWEALQQYYAEHQSEATWLWPPRPADDWFRAYYRMLMDFDPVPHWKRVVCPVLFFFGELDANVPPAASWPPIQRALRESGNRRATLVVLPNANHLFLEARTGTRDEYAGLSRFVPGYFDGMASWLRAQVP